MPIEIEFADVRWKKIPLLNSRIAKAHAAALNKSDASKQVTVLLADDKALRSLNQEWRGKDKPTNVLSFPAAKVRVPRGEIASLGDIALSFDTVVKEAAISGISSANHLTHLVVHGLLHLVGFDHENDADAEKMEAREIRILAKLGIANPYMLDERHERTR